MCSPAVRLRGTDRWPFWLALEVSQWHPIPLVQMVVHCRAKTNSSSTQGPNKITDLKLQGHAWRFCLHLSALLSSLENKVGWGEGKGWERWVYEVYFITDLLSYSLILLNAYFPDILVIIMSANASSVSALLSPGITCLSNSVGGTVVSFSLKSPFQSL